MTTSRHHQARWEYHSMKAEKHQDMATKAYDRGDKARYEHHLRQVEHHEALAHQAGEAMLKLEVQGE
jgi:hypothetical protein